jgi:hypothetical protein
MAAVSARGYRLCGRHYNAQLAIVEADCFALTNEQIVSPLGGHWDDRLLRDRSAGQARHPERPVLQLLRSYDFLRDGGGDLNHDHHPPRRHENILPRQSCQYRRHAGARRGRGSGNCGCLLFPRVIPRADQRRRSDLWHVHRLAAPCSDWFSFTNRSRCAKLLVSCSPP